ncbi:glycosyltransferase family 2 protein [Gaetbulibacter aestuarii]|uniref:Glycosyltransferase family 2 protein n=1 Tax=Gaetbulibacter aestuarii TaxID=1502358 RepID=A0ABW7N3X8_9FLAO
MKLSIIILNYNVRYFLELCLKSVQAATKQLNAEIIVVDNYSTDDSCAMVKTLFPEITLIQNDVNYGFSKGNNIGVAKASGDYLCFLNPDTVVAEDTFEKLLEFAEQKRNLGILGCKLIDGSGNFLPESKRNIPKIGTAFKKLLGFSKHYYATQIEEHAIQKVDVLTGAFMILKRNVFHTIGGFDEQYFMYGEDIDLSYCSLKHGFENYYFGKTTVLHFKGESTIKDAIYAMRFFGAMKIFYTKHFKRNILLDLLVFLGIKCFKLSRRSSRGNQPRPQMYLLHSNKLNDNLQKVLNYKLILNKEGFAYQNDVQVIFDANYLKYKEIISQIEQHASKATFKILPNNTHFILGSNSSFGRGEILTFQ